MVDEDYFPPDLGKLFLQSNLTAIGGEMAPGMCGDDVEAPYRGRDYERVEIVYGGAQPRKKRQ